MGQKFHINKHGVPAPCRAQKGNCPYGGEDRHFKTRQEAQAKANQLYAEEFGVYSVNSKRQSVHRNVRNKRDRQYIARQMNRIRNQPYPKKKYIDRINWSRRMTAYLPNNRKTEHYSRDRQVRTSELVQKFGEGELVGYYKVNHEVKGEYIDQIIEIRDTGQMSVYDAGDGREITSFIGNPQRIEITMMMAGDIPDKEWLNEVEENKFIFDTEIRKLKRRRRRRVS